MERKSLILLASVFSLLDFTPLTISTVSTLPVIIFGFDDLTNELFLLEDSVCYEAICEWLSILASKQFTLVA